MTSTQNQAIWELCRQGLHEAAYRAERAWLVGQRFVPEPGAPLTRSIAQLIGSGNWEVQTGMAPSAQDGSERTDQGYPWAA